MDRKELVIYIDTHTKVNKNKVKDRKEILPRYMVAQSESATNKRNPNRENIKNVLGIK